MMRVGSVAYLLVPGRPSRVHHRSHTLWKAAVKAEAFVKAGLLLLLLLLLYNTMNAHN